MLLDTTHKKWAVGTLALALAAFLLYLGLRRLTGGDWRGGSLAGLWFGIAAGFLTVLAGFLAALRPPFAFMPVPADSVGLNFLDNGSAAVPAGSRRGHVPQQARRTANDTARAVDQAHRGEAAERNAGRARSWPTRAG